MLGKILQKKLMPKLAKVIKPKLLELIPQIKNYRDSIELEAPEVVVVGLIYLDKGKCYISPCAMRVSERGKLEVSRQLQKYDVEDLADLLTQNMDKVDLSTILTDTEDE